MWVNQHGTLLQLQVLLTSVSTLVRNVANPFTCYPCSHGDTIFGQQDLHRHDAMSSDTKHAEKTATETERKWLAAEKKAQELEKTVKLLSIRKLLPKHHSKRLSSWITRLARSMPVPNVRVSCLRGRFVVSSYSTAYNIAPPTRHAIPRVA